MGGHGILSNPRSLRSRRKGSEEAARDMWLPNRVVSGVLTLGFMAVTAVPLLRPPLTRNGVDEKAIRECRIIANFVKEKVRRHIFASTG
ncbi:hypothetical protein CDL15_Pgr007372 [Punica granatum]|uniref:Uncharacterized protein n=1 Tax=Punica granatum TaxID=22663 RepID=A0A218X8T6_PUNGR|nr:hypothetical protein CDL15_Pgr007372 [Punica granatum]